MLAFKRFISVAVLVYLLLAALFFLVPAVRTTVAEWGAGLSPTENERNFYQVLAAIGAVLMAVQLVVENIDSGVLRRTVGQQDSRINELKAKLYDHQTTTPSPASPGVAYPTAAEAAGREQPRSTTPPASDALPNR